MLRADGRDEGERGPGDVAERRDLPEAAHSHLGDEHLRVGLEPEDRERQAELVVAARLRGDRRRHPSTERRERVLRGRLPRRADHGDDLGVGAVAHAAGECGERGFLVARHERRRARRTRLVDVPHAGVEGDEEVPRRC